MYFRRFDLIWRWLIIQISKHRERDTFGTTSFAPIFTFSIAFAHSPRHTHTHTPHTIKWTWAPCEYIMKCIHIPRSPSISLSLSLTLGSRCVCFFYYVNFIKSHLCASQTRFTLHTHKRLNVNGFSIDEQEHEPLYLYLIQYKYAKLFSMGWKCTQNLYMCITMGIESEHQSSVVVVVRGEISFGGNLPNILTSADIFSVLLYEFFSPAFVVPYLPPIEWTRRQNYCIKLLNFFPFIKKK